MGSGGFSQLSSAKPRGFIPKVRSRRERWSTKLALESTSTSPGPDFQKECDSLPSKPLHDVGAPSPPHVSVIASEDGKADPPPQNASTASRSTSDLAQEGLGSDIELWSDAHEVTPISNPTTNVASGSDLSAARPSEAEPNSDSDASPPPECLDCQRHDVDVWYCHGCKSYYCDDCWEKQTLHFRKRNPSEHVKVDPELEAKIRDVLEPSGDQRELHRDDEKSSWFGVHRFLTPGKVPALLDYGRLGDLIRLNAPEDCNEYTCKRDDRTPSLVSFVGETGAGKSTLIRFLIIFGIARGESRSVEAPVPGKMDSVTPTSEDVHLYEDTHMAKSETPILFADCEGFEGGVPQATQSRIERWRTWGGRAAKTMFSDETPSSRVVSERQLMWLKKRETDGPKMEFNGKEVNSSRKFIAKELYPRLLYPFSDAIVYVLGGSTHRTFEKALEALIEWADAAICTSSNQTLLPHAILVLNSSEDIESQIWDVSANTEKVFRELGRLDGKALAKYADAWRQRGEEKRIETVKDLALCYYSSVQIIRMPGNAKPILTQTQVTQLRSSILNVCEKARQARRQVGMLLDVEELQTYFHDAFSHYASDLSTPFDFVQASFRNSPIPAGFGGSVQRLAVNVLNFKRERSTERDKTPEAALYEISYTVASSIMLASARSRHKGDAGELLASYAKYLDVAVQMVLDKHWPCDFESPKGRCVNTRFGHAKGHQSKDGRVLGLGDYETSVDGKALKKDFKRGVRALLSQFRVLLNNEATAHFRTSQGTIANPQGHLALDRSIAARIHKKRIIPNFLTKIGASNMQQGGLCIFSSQKACLYCLSGAAEYPIPCGHILCKDCLEESGRWEDTAVEVAKCPVGCPGGWDRCMLYLKPPSTGPRVLSLDGSRRGGIRGIAELEVLRQIQKSLGGEIPIRSFFDLIVGTSTGGLIALGLSCMDYTVDECIKMFEQLCDEAFTKAHLTGHSGPLSVFDMIRSSRYKTKPLKTALQQAFPKDLYLFGGSATKAAPSRRCGSPIKVAVTATEDGDRSGTTILSNYNPPVLNDSNKFAGYYFQRPEGISEEVQVWEAARATSAAPGYFKPFRHEASRKVYLDGAIFHNNPIRIADRELRLLWPKSEVPDIILSLGTGIDEDDLERRDKDDVEPRIGSAPSSLAKSAYVAWAMRPFNNLKQRFDLLTANMQKTLNCEQSWTDFFASSVKEHDRFKYVRLNPRLAGPLPELDDKKKMKDYREDVEDWAAKTARSDIERVARQLVAASFYFETTKPGNHLANEKVHIEGVVLSQITFPEDIGKLGMHLKKVTEELRMSSKGESLSFVTEFDSISETGKGEETASSEEITTKDLERMISTETQRFEKVLSFDVKQQTQMRIYLEFGSKQERHLISGFPRLPSQLGRRRASIHPLPVSNTPSRRRSDLSLPKSKSSIDWEYPELERYPELEYRDLDRSPPVSPV
ncbi:uncharacterized protein B0H64DRAFT_468830 [Chaetomium fimeti]|uniref:PNPLA domain-containing protein n=1 Tax=Chaetomium fimeti TaxID=1854472 RepID=A0AAE0H8M9_9PEZI|nr:hypothetical protein B0H64DRAFT_468830 [Chaetomium fimeti]